jgi:rubredoxin
MAKYRCIPCGYIYDEDTEGLKFAELSATWTCPLCGAKKDQFEIIDEDEEELFPSEPEREEVGEEFFSEEEAEE